MIKVPEKIQWKEHNKDQTSAYDGDIYLLAVEVTNSASSKKYFEIVKVRVSCDWDGESGFFDLIHADCSEDTVYDDWCWSDFEWAVKIS